ncbi:hypothetical protein [Ruegeria atlantica]|uniref:hypothetical protein n=1 Tax=Ruegeria atlantica TaxID=81569 RepID=UPI00147E4C0E|nr:hypothetical protein [Ruegeria atlantica]
MLGTDGLFVNRVYDRPIQRFAVVGERSSGTNISEFIIRRALGLKPSNELGWKHGFVQGVGISKDVLVVVCVRDPYDWLASMYDKPWHCAASMRNLGFSGFIRAPWDSEIDRPKGYFKLPPNQYSNIPILQDRDPLTGLRFDNLIRMRTTKLRHWTGLANGLCNLVVWRFEAFKENPDAFLGVVAQNFGTSLIPFEWPDQPMGVMPPNMRQGKVGQISSKDVDFINSQLDADLEQSLGYSFRSAED